MRIWTVAAASPADIPPIAEDMREADRREVWASDRWSPCTALEKSLALSPLAWTCHIEGKPAFMWGVACGALPGVGVPWLLGTEDMYRVHRQFLVQSRAYVGRMHEAFPRLENKVHADNTLSIRWLTWCGFTIEPQPEQRNGENFFQFWRVAECVSQ